MRAPPRRTALHANAAKGPLRGIHGPAILFESSGGINFDLVNDNIHPCHVTVYDKAGMVITKIMTGHPGGNAKVPVAVWSSRTVGRVNIYCSGGAHEGGGPSNDTVWCRYEVSGGIAGACPPAIAVGYKFCVTPCPLLPGQPPPCPLARFNIIGTTCEFTAAGQFTNCKGCPPGTDQYHR
jgi:hypothetical protein